MICHICRFLKRTTVFQIRRNAGSTERVATPRRVNPGRLVVMDHGISIGLGRGTSGEHTRSSVDRPEQRTT